MLLTSYGGGGGWGVLALEMGRGVPLRCLKPDPVPIRIMATKTPYPNFEINTEFNWLFYCVISTNILNILLSFKLFIICLCSFALRLEKSDGIQLMMAWKISKINASRVPRVVGSKKHPSQFWKLKKETLSSGTSLVLPSMKVPLPPGLLVFTVMWFV